MKMFILLCSLLVLSQSALAEEQSAQDNRFLEVDFSSLYHEYKEKKKTLTDFAFDAWWKQVNETLEGQYVRGTAIIENVKDGWTGLHVDMGTGNKEELLSVRLYIDKNDETEIQAALALKPTESLTFTGKLDSITSVFGAISVVFLEGAIGHEFKIQEPDETTTEINTEDTAEQESSIDGDLVLDSVSTAIKVLQLISKKKK